MKHLTSLMAREITPKPERNNGKSLTVPDQTMSIKELLRRHQNGMMPQGYEPVYDPDDELPDFRKMDLTEVDELRSKQVELINQFKKEQNELKTKLQKFRHEEEFRRKYPNLQPANDDIRRDSRTDKDSTMFGSGVHDINSSQSSQKTSRQET